MGAAKVAIRHQPAPNAGPYHSPVPANRHPNSEAEDDPELPPYSTSIP